MEREIPDDIQQDTNNLYPDNGRAVITTAAMRKAYIDGRMEEREKMRRFIDYLQKNYTPCETIGAWELKGGTTSCTSDIYKIWKIRQIGK